MASNGAEFSGKTVEEAVASGLESLGLGRDDVDIDILNRGSRGILGFGSEPALVRISPRQTDIGAPPETEVDEIDELVSTDETILDISSGASEDVILIDESVIEES